VLRVDTPLIPQAQASAGLERAPPGVHFECLRRWRMLEDPSGNVVELFEPKKH